MNGIMHTQFYFRYLEKSPELLQANNPALGGYTVQSLKKRSYTQRTPESSQANDPALGGYII